jgi:NTP pyrophosphatase (non-canonical NTP hydrolase)
VDLDRLSDDVEVVSRGYARAHGINRDGTWFLLKLQEEVGELTQAFLMRTGQARTKGNSPQELDEKFGAELADVLSHVLLMARHHDIDLEKEIEQKWLVWHPDRSGRARSEANGPQVLCQGAGIQESQTSARTD